MAELTIQMTERDIKTLQAMMEINQPTAATDVGDITGNTPLNVGKAFRRLKKIDLVKQVNKEHNTWETTEKAEAYLQELFPQQSVTVDELTGKLTGKPETELTGGTPTEPLVPTQADHLREIGKRLGIGTGAKDAAKLDAIIYYVQRVANLENFTEVWNALTEMMVAPDIKKRWIKLYAQSLVDKQIRGEHKKKLGAGQELRREDKDDVAKWVRS